MEDKLGTKTVKVAQPASPILTKVKGDSKVKVATSSRDATDFKEYRALRLKEMGRS
jgi:hypothetical protein